TRSREDSRGPTLSTGEPPFFARSGDILGDPSTPFGPTRELPIPPGPAPDYGGDLSESAQGGHRHGERDEPLGDRELEDPSHDELANPVAPAATSSQTRQPRPS